MLPRVRTISNSGRKSPVCRPPSPRFTEAAPVKLPPLPSVRSIGPPALRAISPVVVDALSSSSTPFHNHLKSSSPRPTAPHFDNTISIPFLLFPSSPTTQSPGPDYANSIGFHHGELMASSLCQPRDLTSQIERDRDYAACGGYGLVYTGQWNDNGKRTKVAIKVLQPRTNIDDTSKLNKSLRREIKVWARLHHDNIVPLLGITNDNFGPCLSPGMVSPWMEHGNLTLFLNQRPNLRSSDRWHILRDVAAGLGYLHSNGVIHGDLTGANILIDHDGKARLVDFGLSTVKAEFEGTSYYSSVVGGALPWRAPELFLAHEDEAPPVLSAPCDIYSFGMVTLQVLTGRTPYHNLTEPKLLFALFRGRRPERPTEPWVMDTHWDFIRDCWNIEPSARPRTNDVKTSIDGFYQTSVEGLNRASSVMTPSFLAGPKPARRYTAPADGYETDSEALAGSRLTQMASGWASEQDDAAKSKKLAKRSRKTRLGSLTLLNVVRTRKMVAPPTVKTIDLNKGSGRIWKEYVMLEVSSLKAATHPNVRNITDVEAIDADILRITLEPIIGTCLSDILRRFDLTVSQVPRICFEIVHGLKHLHQLGIVHGNLNSRNVVLDTHGRIKLIDLGISAKFLREQSATDRNDLVPHWTAPEFIHSGEYAAAMDSWSVGILAIELVEKKPPYFDESPRYATELISAGSTPRLKDPSAFTPNHLEFLSLCLVGNTLERATSTELSVHPFLANAPSPWCLAPLLLDAEIQHNF